MVIEVPNGYDVSRLRLTEVLFSPEVGYTLVSIGRLDELGLSTTFAEGFCMIRRSDGETIGQIPRTLKGLYRVVHEHETANATDETVTVMELHQRYGHIAPSVACWLVENGLVGGLKFDESKDGGTFCESCVYAKATHKPIAKIQEGERSKEVGTLVWSDVWGPTPKETLGGWRYYVTFTDDHSRLTYLCTLRQKSETFLAYQQFEAWLDRQLAAKIRMLHSDQGGEYTGNEFVLYLKRQGTVQHLTAHDTPQHNGIAERLNRTILERVRALLHASGLPKFLWGEAACHVVWLKNRTPTKVLDGLTPYKVAFGRKPDLSKVREWGSEVYAQKERENKLGWQVDKVRWMGIDDKSENAYHVYWPMKWIVTVERNVYWRPLQHIIEGEEEGTYPSNATLAYVNDPQPRATATAKSGLSVPQPQATISTNTTVTLPTPDPITAPRPKRIRQPSQRVLNIINGKAVDPAPPRGIQLPNLVAEDPKPNSGPAVFEGEGMADQTLAAVNYDDDVELALQMHENIAEAEALEPTSLAEAKRRPDWLQWEQGIREELATLDKAGTWELVDPPAGANIVGSKWVFRVKKDAAGNVVHHKACLVAQGFSQVPGVDYFDTYAPVAKLASIRTVLALAARLDLELHQIDIKGVYLNGKLNDEEAIYMHQPPGYADPALPRHVCHLRKTLCRLKQSGRRWYQKLVEILVKNLGCKLCEVDQAVFIKRSEKTLIIIVVHVNDCTIAASALSLVVELKTQIRKHVKITDLSKLHWLLGIEVTRNRKERTIALSQRSYLESITRRFSFDNLKPVSTPMEPHIKLTNAQSPSTGAEYASMQHIPYREAIGSLMYAALGTHPDISYTVSTISRFSSNPGLPHWEAVQRIYRYLIGTKDLRLTYGGTRKPLHGYTDVDGSMAEDWKAVSGYAFLIDSGAVSWASKKQEIILLSTTESEYVATTHATKEALWLRSFIGEVLAPLDVPITLFSDNQSAIALAKDHQYHAHTKHIDICFHFIHWVVDDSKI